MPSHGWVAECAATGGIVEGPAVYPDTVGGACVVEQPMHFTVAFLY